MRFLLLSVLLMELLLSGVYSGDVLVEPRAKKPQCKSPKGKVGDASFYDCGQAVCKRSGKSADWNICPQNAKQTTVEEIQKTGKETELIVKETEKTVKQIKQKVNETEIKVKEIDMTVKETKKSVNEIEKTGKETKMIVKETEETVKQIKKKVNETEIIVKETDMTVKETKKSVNEIEKTGKETEKIVKETENTVNKIEKKLNETEITVKETERTVKETENTVNEIEKKVKETEITVKETENAMNEIEKKVNILLKLAQSDGNLPVVFYKPQEFAIEKNNLVTTLAFLREEYILTFDLLLTTLGGGTLNIFHLGLGGNYDVYGERNPAVYLYGNGFHTCSSISGNKNYCKNIYPPLKAGTWIHWEFSHILIDNKHIFEVKVDDISYWRIENDAPAAFEKVKFFGSDNFYNPADGKIKNLKIQTKEE